MSGVRWARAGRERGGVVRDRSEEECCTQRRVTLKKRRRQRRRWRWRDEMDASGCSREEGVI